MALKARSRLRTAAILAGAGLCLAAPPALSEDGGTASPSVEQPSGTDSSGGDSKAKPKRKKKHRVKGARLRSFKVKPRKSFFYSRRRPKLTFELRGKKRRDLVITAVRSLNATPVRSWTLENVRPGKKRILRWGGRIRGYGAAPRGEYEFTIANPDGSPADLSRAATRRAFRLYDHKFPVLGPHFYGDGLGAGRGHRGFDVAADCGTPVIAARGGTVQWRAFQKHGAGFYLVVDGAATKRDYVYMHLKKRGRVREGEKVRTGQTLGYIGSTGRSTGCHLHFEVWAGPGWAEGGKFLDAEKLARQWDTWGRFAPPPETEAKGTEDLE